MKLHDLLTYHIGSTCLDPVLVKGFLQAAPRYRQWGLCHQVNLRSLERLNVTDLCEFYLRLYLTGRHKTLHAVLWEVRAFVHVDTNAAHYLITYSLDDMRRQLLILEWYELLPLLANAREQILKLAPKLTNQAPPGVVRFLEESYQAVN